MTIDLISPFKYTQEGTSFITKVKRIFAKNKKQISAGCIVYYFSQGTPLFLLLFEAKRNNVAEWGFPKGKMEKKDKTVADRALQEVKEETGLIVELGEQLGENRYIFYADEKNKKIDKTVVYYLAQAKSQDVDFYRYTNDPREAENFKDYRWLPIEDALNLLQYEFERGLIKKAFEIVSNSPNK